MKKEIFFAILILSTVGCSTPPIEQHHAIIFYKPYTDSLETSFYNNDTSGFSMQKQFTNLKNADVLADWRRSIERKDYRFVALTGVTYVFPGLSGYEIHKKGDSVFCSVALGKKKYVDQYNFKVVDGTNDVEESWMPDVQSQAYNYAKKYNLLMLSVVAKFNKQVPK